jgi:hypothetical protein
METEDDRFVALGPGSTGFWCFGANIDWGGLMAGREVGLYAKGLDAGPEPPGGREPPRKGTKAGLWGTVQDGFGVIGTSGNSSGVYGQSGEAFGVAPAGVCGTSQQQIGVYASSLGNRGVFGESERSIGVHGASTASIGVQGWSGRPGPNFGGERSAGVFGTSQTSPGVIGTSAQSFGVAGTSQALPGVIGTSTASFGMIAISGQAGPIFGLPFPLPGAVLATSANNPGVIATSTASYGVAALSAAPPPSGTALPQDVPAGVYGRSTNGCFGVLGVANSTPTSGGAGVTGIAASSSGIGVLGYHPFLHGTAGAFAGDVHVVGPQQGTTSDLYVTGQIFAGVKDAIVPFPDGSRRLLHCMESPEHWFEDFGSARLKRGRATVKLDADFAKVVMLDGYRVFLTPEGDCKGLYVQRKRGASFEVRELQGGNSDAAFSYRIVAKRKDIKRHARFAKFETPALPMPIGKASARKARAARGRKPARLPAAMRAMFTTLDKKATS